MNMEKVEFDVKVLKAGVIECLDSENDIYRVILFTEDKVLMLKMSREAIFFLEDLIVNSRKVFWMKWGRQDLINMKYLSLEEYEKLIKEVDGDE